MQPALKSVDDHDVRVFEIEKNFRLSINENQIDAAWHISDAGARIETGCNSTTRLTVNERENLRYSLFSAVDAACRNLPDDIERSSVRLGFRVFAELLDFWSADDAERAAYGDRIRDLHARARIFRNQLHSLVLAGEIAARQVARSRAARGQGATPGGAE